MKQLKSALAFLNTYVRPIHWLYFLLFGGSSYLSYLSSIEITMSLFQLTYLLTAFLFGAYLFFLYLQFKSEKRKFKRGELVAIEGQTGKYKVLRYLNWSSRKVQCYNFRSSETIVMDDVLLCPYSETQHTRSTAVYVGRMRTSNRHRF